MTADEAALRAFDAIAGPALVPWFAVLMIAEARWPLRRRVEAWVPHVDASRSRSTWCTR
jgi:hypothetical protein